MAYKKTAHKRRRARSSRRKNVKSRKVMRGGAKFNSVPQCTASYNNAPNKSDWIKKYLGPGEFYNYSSTCKLLSPPN